jgi:CTP synthase
MNKKHSPVKINRAETKSYKDNMPENNKNNFLPFNLPFASFTYKSMSISYDGKDTHVKARNVSMENNELKDEKLEGIDGLLVAPGFGSRGVDGKLDAVKWAREGNVPFFGICLGMQCAVIEFARNVMGLSDAHSTEIKEYTQNPVISLMAEQKSITNLGGTMRLGAYTCELKEGFKARDAYGAEEVEERHRHRFEFNNDYIEAFTKAGMVPTGFNPDSGLVEIVEIPEHPYFVGVQFHPEYKSTVANPHPLFIEFVKAALDNQQKSGKNNKSSREVSNQD